MSNHTNEKLFKDGELQSALEQSSRAALADFERAAQSEDADKNVKLFGLFDMPAPMAALVGGAWNEGTRLLGDIIAHNGYSMSEKLLRKHSGLGDTGIARTATVAAVGANVALGGSIYFANLVRSVREHRRNYKQVARAIAPVLEDIRGNHSVGSLMSIREQDNEMVYAHRQGMALKMRVDTTNNVVDLLVNGLPKIVTTDKLHSMWSGAELQSGKVAADAARLAAEHGPSMTDVRAGVEAGSPQPESNSAKLMNWVKTTISMGSSPVATYITATNNRKLAKNSRAFSALDMVLELDKQVAGDTDHTSRSFTLPGHGRESYSLEDYIVCIMKLHQSQMADLNDKHTELRDALMDDATRAAKQLARAIREGEISTLSLVRLIGEGRIILRQGRAIASEAQVHDQIQRLSGKQSTYVHVDPSEYYKDAAFTRDQLKTALKSLEGQERQIFASMFPNEVLEEAGMSAKDIKNMREATANHYDTTIAEAIIGLNSKSDEALKEIGFAENEVAQLRAACTKLQETGLGAVKTLKTNAANDHGIEHLLTNAVVHQPKHLGVLIKDGRQEVTAMAANDDEAPRLHRESPDTHTKRLDHHRREAANHGHVRGVGNE